MENSSSTNHVKNEGTLNTVGGGKEYPTYSRTNEE